MATSNGELVAAAAELVKLSGRSVASVDEAKARHRKLVQTLGQPLEFAASRRSNLEFVFIAGQPQAARLGTRPGKASRPACPGLQAPATFVSMNA